MPVWGLLLIISNVGFFVILIVLWKRLKKPPQEDPRLSRGLQLLQSKISVLEDLSDRTDVQVKQLTSLLEQKSEQLQKKIFEAQQHVEKVEQSMAKSREVAEIFQDKIPHEEIIERQNTISHVKAAQMAHAGYSVEDIMKEVDLPREQVEFIAKINREQLMFDPENLPEWARTESQEKGKEPDDFQFMENPQAPQVADSFSNSQDNSLQQLGEQFREACKQFEETEINEEEKSSSANSGSRAVASAKQKMNQLVDRAAGFLDDHSESPARNASAPAYQDRRQQQAVRPFHVGDEIKQVTFPRLDNDKDSE